MKKVGLLLPIFSIPNNYGIGDFGEEAYEFIDILSNFNMSYWEILPINPTDDNNCPYSPTSSFAINPLFISLEELKKINLLTDIKKLPITKRIDYQYVKKYKESYYHIAYNNFNSNHPLYKEYLKYLDTSNEYALFMSLKANNNNCSWHNFINKYDENEFKYQSFLQFIAEYQWLNLKAYANKKNISIIGDLPIYVTYESSDIYYHRQSFQLNKDKMEYVSGASPDYFSSDGQKWGNPIYDFDFQKKDNYQYLLKRYEYANKLFDFTRVDHFRAFSSYYKIPIDKPATDGIWEEGPGHEFIDLLSSKIDLSKLVVEDLGADLEKVYLLRDYYKLSGMKIFMYTFNFSTGNDECLDSHNMIVYPGNHDNNTILGWYKKLSPKNKDTLKKFLKEYHGPINEKIIKYLLDKPYRFLIIMVQDILGDDENARINIPGANKQWTYRLTSFEKLKKNLKKY